MATNVIKNRYFGCTFYYAIIQKIAIINKLKIGQKSAHTISNKIINQQNKELFKNVKAKFQ